MNLLSMNRHGYMDGHSDPSHKDRWRSTSLVLYKEQKEQQRKDCMDTNSSSKDGVDLSFRSLQRTPRSRDSQRNGHMGPAARKLARVRKKRPKSLPAGIQLTDALNCSMKNETQKKKRLEKEALSHPVLSLILSKGDALNSLSLHDFVEQYSGVLPCTFTQFFREYLNFLVIQHLQFSRGQNAPQHLRWNTQASIEKLAKVAALNSIQGHAISYQWLEKMLPSDADIFDVYNQQKQGGFQPDMIFRTFGLLEITDAEHKQVMYRFKEPYVQEYLVAVHLFNEALFRTQQGKSSLASALIKEAMKKLQSLGQVWRMTFGLLSSEAPLESQSQLLQALITEAKQMQGVRPFDITSLCVECTYESQNQGELTDLLDDFTLNQTIIYSNIYMSPARLPYTISAVGYLVRACPNVYGLHMSNFAINEKNVGMLADPVNEISDNNLQLLNLSHNSIGANGMKKLQRFIVKATNLSHLDLSHCQLGSMSVAILSEFFMCVPLIYLRLTSNGIGDGGLKVLSSNLKYVPTLEWLDLSENDITDSSAIRLADALPALPNLRNLDLSKNKISDEGCEGITRQLSKLNRITSLMLSDNQIGAEGLEHASKHVWKSRSLRFMNISLNHLPEGGILGLRRAANSHGSLKIEVASEGESFFIQPDADGEDNADLYRSVDLLSMHSPTHDKWSTKDMRKSWHGIPGSNNNNNNQKQLASIPIEH